MAWLLVVPSGEIQVVLWMFLGSKHVLAIVIFSEAARFIKHTQLSLLSSWRLYFLIVGRNACSLPTLLAFMSPSIIWIYVFLLVLHKVVLFRPLVDLPLVHETVIEELSSLI